MRAQAPYLVTSYLDGRWTPAVPGCPTPPHPSDAVKQEQDSPCKVEATKAQRCEMWGKPTSSGQSQPVVPGLNSGLLPPTQWPGLPPPAQGAEPAMPQFTP